MNQYGEKTCPECGKTFLVNWPEHWVYKRTVKNTVMYFCTWKCFRSFERSNERKKCGKMRLVTDEQKKEAVQIVLNGGDPRPFLEELGVKAPDVMWYEIKNKVKLEDPETYAKLPKALPARKRTPAVAPEAPKTAGDAMAGMQEAADKFFGACEDMGLKMETPEKPLPVQDLKLQPGGNYRISVETPEAPKICKPVIYDGMIIREVESLFGRLRRSDVHGSIYLDFEPTDSADVLSYTVDQWRSFFRDLKDCAAILGVEL